MTIEPIRDLGTILLDTGPFCRFCEAGALDQFASYLGGRCHVTQDVAVEIHYRGTKEHGGLRMLTWRTPPFPQHPPVRLVGAAAKQAERIHARKQRPGNPPLADLGEISTVVAATTSGGKAVMIDDRFGRSLAKQRGLPLYSTTDLAVEMTAAGCLEAKLGWRIFHRVYREPRARFEASVTTARTALQR